MLQNIRPFLVVLVFTVFACDKAEQQADNTSPVADKTAAAVVSTAAPVSHAEIRVPTIQCGTCVDNIDDALSEVKGISKAKVDLKAKITFVDFDSSQVDLRAIETAIAKAGYNANDTQRDPEGYAALDRCCKLPEDRK